MSSPRWSNAPIMVTTPEGDYVKLRDYCRERGLAYTTIWGRIKKGWSVDTALSKPLHREPGRKGRHAGGYVKITGTGVSEHVLVVQQVLGRPLPDGSEIHHVNGIKSDNRKENLVVCPSRSYHMLLHARQRAADECGNPDYRKCEICGKWDDPSTMYVRKTKSGNWHRSCASKSRSERKRRSKNASATRND